MKVLLVSRDFYPEISPRSFRTTELLKEFIRRGYQVTMIAEVKHPEQWKMAEDWAFDLIDLGPRRWRSISIHPNGVWHWISRLMRRMAKVFLEHPDIELLWSVRKRLRGQKDFDLALSIAVPHPIHWGVARALDANPLLARTWIADCGDPYMGQENDTFRPAFYFKYLEKYFCRRADVIAVPTKEAIQGYYAEFQSKIKVVPQGFDFDSISLKHHEIKGQRVRFAYAGGFIPGRRDPRPLLDHLLEVDVDFEFYIYTNHRSLVEDYEKPSNGRIKVLDPLPREELLTKLAGMHFLLNLENRGQRQVPSKLIDYSIVGRPILSLNSQDLNLPRLDRFLMEDYSDAFVVQDLEQYRIENVVDKFISFHEW